MLPVSACQDATVCAIFAKGRLVFLVVFQDKEKRPWVTQSEKDAGDLGCRVWEGGSHVKDKVLNLLTVAYLWSEQTSANSEA